MTILSAVIRFLLRIPRGLGLICAAVNAWRTDAKHASHRAAELTARPGQFTQIRARHDAHRRQRTGMVLLAVAVTGILLTLAEAIAGPFVWWITMAVAVAAAATVGRPATSAATATIPASTRQGRLTTGTVVDCLTAAVPEILRAVKDKPDAVNFPDPPARDGNGWHLRIELPPGVTTGTVANRQAELASAFRRPPLAISVEPDPAHNGMAALWIGDSIDTSDVAWTLAGRGEVDVLTGFPIGVDVRGRPVDLSLMNKSGLIGAMPGYGKTATLRMILLAAALDVRTQIYAYDLKGGVDLLPLEPASERVVAGDEPEDIEQLRDDLRAIQNEIRARNKLIRTLPVDQRPDGQITTDDATRLGFAPTVFAIDEAQIAYEDATYGKEIAELTVDIFKRGRSVGIHMLLATQQFDATSIPPRISRSAQLRMCGRVDGWQESNMILGANAHSSGISATVFGEDDRGVMWVKGSGRSRIVRMARVTSAQARQVVARAVELRQMHQPAPVEPDEFPQLALARPEPAAPGLPPAHDLVGRVRHVWPDGEDKLWTETILGLLREQFPGDYATTTTAELSAKLPGKSRQIWKKPAGADKGSNRQGYALAAILDASPPLADD